MIYYKFKTNIEIYSDDLTITKTENPINRIIHFYMLSYKNSVGFQCGFTSFHSNFTLTKKFITCKNCLRCLKNE